MAGQGQGGGLTPSATGQSFGNQPTSSGGGGGMGMNLQQLAQMFNGGANSNQIPPTALPMGNPDVGNINKPPPGPNGGPSGITSILGGNTPGGMVGAGK